MEFSDLLDKRLSLLDYSIRQAQQYLLNRDKMISILYSNMLSGILILMLILTIYLFTAISAQTQAHFIDTSIFDLNYLKKNTVQVLYPLALNLIVEFALFTYQNIVLCLDLVAFLTTICICIRAHFNYRHLESARDELDAFVKNQEVGKKIGKKTKKSTADSIRVSVLIAARNEEDRISDCVISLMNQTYGNYEIMVMDDGSSDRTPEVLDSLEDRFGHIPVRREGKQLPRIDQKMTNRPTQRFKRYRNDHLPSNWYGKAWSLHCLGLKAKSKVLIFLDADTIAQPNLLRYCVEALNRREVDFLSGATKQILDSFGLKIIVPSMFLMPSYMISLPKIRNTTDANTSFAIGQLMVIKKNVFDEIGGFEGVRNKICEDLQFAIKLKEAGFKIDFISLSDHILCNMYNSFSDAFFGMAKNVFSAINYSWIKYLYSTLIFGSIAHPIITFIIMPFYFDLISTNRIALNLASIILFSISWSRSLQAFQQPASRVVFYPFMILTMFSVSAYSTFTTFLTKGHVWRDRHVI